MSLNVFIQLNIGTAYEKYITDDIYPDEPPIEDSPTDISRDDLDDRFTDIDDGNLAYNLLGVNVRIYKLSLSMKLESLFHRLAYNIKHFTRQIQYSERTAKKMIRSHWIYLEVSKDQYQLS